MREGPDTARANMLTAQMGGKALTATERAAKAGMTAQTTLADDAVGAVFAIVLGQPRTRNRIIVFSTSGRKAFDSAFPL